MTIIEYINAKNMLIQFNNGYVVKADYKEFKIGNIQNPYNKTVYNIGYLGEGIYSSKINYKQTEQYIAWKSMLQRCYSEKLHKR